MILWVVAEWQVRRPQISQVNIPCLDTLLFRKRDVAKWVLRVCNVVAFRAQLDI